MTLGSLWNYYRDEVDNVDDNASDGQSFKYKRKLVAKTPERLERPPQSPPNPEGSQPPRPLQPKVPTLKCLNHYSTQNVTNFWNFLIYHWYIVKQNLIYHGQ